MLSMTFKRFFAFCALFMALFLTACGQSSEPGKLNTPYFDADLGTNWVIDGGMQSMSHSLNVKLTNKTAQTSIHIVVGGNYTPNKLLMDLQDALRQERANVSPIMSNGVSSHFDFSKNGIPGFAISATDGTDVSCITVIGSKAAAQTFMRTWTNRNQKLIPNF